MKHINKNQIPQLLEQLAKEYQVIAPVKTEGIIKFKPWQKEAQLELTENSAIPPKDIFFPQSEDLYAFKKLEGKTVVETPSLTNKQVLFGVRACDATSFAMMDDVFLTKGFVDTYYRDKRDNTVIITISCSQMLPSCFCTSMGISQNGEGADLNFIDAGNSYAIQAHTSRGEELLTKYAAIFQEGSEVSPAELDQPIKVSTEGLADKLAGMFEHSIWEELYKKCMGCGTCTYVCPTCHCFDISVESSGESGVRFRCWDTCMFSEYTRMAGGHNPRPSRKERFRNRFLHKLQYFPERYGKTACVGCGRCMVKCPVAVDITRIIDRLQEVETNV